MRREGVFDSAGGFTLSANKVREKIRGFQLPQPNYYPLKIIQGLLGLGAGAIRLELTRETIVISALRQGSKAPSILSGLTEALAEPLSLPEEYRDLAVGFISAFAADATALELISGGEFLRMTENTLETGTQAYSGSDTEISVRIAQKPPPRPGFFRRLLGWTADVHHHVYGAFDHCTVPIELDGRRVEFHPDRGVARVLLDDIPLLEQIRTPKSWAPPMRVVQHDDFLPDRLAVGRPIGSSDRSTCLAYFLAQRVWEYSETSGPPSVTSQRVV